MQSRTRATTCRYRCGVQVYRFTDYIGRERQICVDGAGSDDAPAHLLWYFRSKWTGWINYEFAKKGANGKTLHVEHVCRPQ